jgi:hypothetical protein
MPLCGMGIDFENPQWSDRTVSYESERSIFMRQNSLSDTVTHHRILKLYRDCPAETD